MLRPLDRDRRDGPLYPGSSRTLRDFIADRHLLVQIDTAFDFTALAAELDTLYDQRIGRPAIHPEIVLRALLLEAIYQVPSRRQLCERLSENLAWRWFCFLTLDDPVFDHSSLSVFLERVGSAGLLRIFAKLNQALVEAELLSSRTYLDSSLLPADVRTQELAPREDTDPLPTAVSGEEVFLAREHIPSTETEPARLRVRRYQDAKGRLPLPGHDRDARWRTIRGKPTLGYKEHILVDRSGFILARGTTPADVSDVAGALPLLDALPIQPKSLTADTGYRAGRFRHALQRRGITAYIPMAPTQDITPEEFTDRGDHFVCQQGALLLPSGVPDEDDSVRYRARAADCRPCPVREQCVSSSRGGKLLWASFYRITYPGAHRLNATVRAAREQRRRKTIVEGVFARLDRLGGTRARVRGRERVNAHATITALAHNILKALTKRRFWRRDGGVLPRPTAARTRHVPDYRLLTRHLLTPIRPLPAFP
jgi:IS5 family transposase